MKRLLIVDDDPDVRESLELALNEAFAVTLAANGVEALQKLEGEPFDAVLLDLMMPILDGRAVVERMREAHIDVPVLIGSAAVDAREQAASVSAPYIAKPYSLDDLEAALARLTRDRDDGPRYPANDGGSRQPLRRAAGA